LPKFAARGEAVALGGIELGMARALFRVVVMSLYAICLLGLVALSILWLEGGGGQEKRWAIVLLILLSINFGSLFWWMLSRLRRNHLKGHDGAPLIEKHQ
jgi:hypothetical protein